MNIESASSVIETSTASGAPASLVTIPASLVTAPAGDKIGSASTKIGSRRVVREPLNRVWLQSLDLNEVIAQAATRSQYAAVLTRSGIPAAEVSTFQSETSRCRQLLTQTTQDRSGAQGSTRTEAALATEVRRLLRRAQAAALQQYDNDPTLRPLLANFGIGVDFSRNHARLAQYSASVIECLQSNPLPALPSTFAQALADTRAEWLASNEAQAAGKQSAMEKRRAAETLLNALLSVRLRIQYAIDGNYPHDEPDSASARAAFHLPPNRPFRAPSRR